MRILYLSPRKCWPAHSGARLRDYHLARQLASRADVVHMAICHPERDALANAGSNLPAPETIFERSIVVSEARPYSPFKLVRGLLGPQPLVVLNWASEAAALRLSELGRSTIFDTIQIEGPHLASYFPVIRSLAGCPAVICDWHDILSENMRIYIEGEKSLVRRMYVRRSAKLLARLENRLLGYCDAHTVVSDRDRASLAARVPATHIDVIENGVDSEYFSADEIEKAYQAWRGARRSDVTRSRIVFIGAMDYHPNVDAVLHFARDAWPGIRQFYPTLRFTVVGRTPPPSVVALGKQEGIEVTGTVTDVRPYYREAIAMVVPLRLGTGTRLKILEGMAAGVPVVSTSVGAEGLSFRVGEEILIANTPQDMQNAVERLHKDPGLAQSIRTRARESVVGRYDWNVVGKALYSLHESIRMMRCSGSQAAQMSG